MARGRKRKSTEKARESNGGAEPEGGEGVEAVKKEEGVLEKLNDGKGMEVDDAKEGVKKPGRRGRKKGKVVGKRDSGAGEMGKGGHLKDRLRNVARKVNYEESWGEGDEDEDRVAVKKRGRKRRKVGQNQASSAKKVDGGKKLLGKRRKKINQTNVANAKENVQNQAAVTMSKRNKVSFVVNYSVISLCLCF